MNKPQIRCELAPGNFNFEWYWINFDATPDAASEMEEFGRVSHSSLTDDYTLWVDRRFDLMEVYRYMKTYGQDVTP